MNLEKFNSKAGEVKEYNDPKWGPHPVFIPLPLPEISLDKELVFLLDRASSKLSELSGIGRIVPHPEALIINYLKKEAVSSTRIEGTQITLSEFLLAEAKEEKLNLNSSEVLNYIETIKSALESLKSRHIDLDLIKQMHKQLFTGETREKDNTPGNFRVIQNWIGPKNSSIEQATFIPPNPEQVVPLLQDLMNYMNSFDQTPILVKIALLHYQFETIHPFQNGNGRIGRALITLYLCKKKKLSKPLFYPSGFFEANKPEYNRLLLKTSQDGSFEDWVKFFLKGIEIQADDALQRAIRLLELHDKYLKLIKERFKTIHYETVAEHLFKSQLVTVKSIRKLLGVSYPTAKNVLEELVKLGVLISPQEQRNKIYIAKEILDVMILD